MARGKRFSPEQIVVMLRQIEVQLAQGKSLALACKEAEISEQSYYRWRREYGGVAVEQAKRLKELERENARLRRLVADLSLEKQVLKDVAAGPEGQRQQNLVQPRATPAGRGWHPRDVRSLRAPRLPHRQPAPRDTTLRAHRAS
jgi:putative transposase